MSIFRGGSWFWWLPISIGAIGTSLTMGNVLHPINLLWSFPCFVGGIMKLMDFDDELKP